MNIHNLRINKKGIKLILSRLETESTLSMGWGGGIDYNLDLGKPSGLWVDFKNCYKDITIRRFNSICKIKSFKDGDVIVVPHLPKDGKFIIGIVDGDFGNCYIYDENDSTHLNHKIKLKKIYGLDSSLDIHNQLVHTWYAKLNWMRLPIYPLNKYKEIFNDLIQLLDSRPGEILGKSDVGEFIESMRDEIRIVIKNKLKKIHPSNSQISFENICKELILSYGYTFRRNSHHQDGGDVDIIFDIADNLSSPFEKSSSSLYVQIKKHDGNSGTKAISQLEKIMEIDNASENSQGCAITLATFNEEAQEEAELKNIVLINGDQLVDMIIEKLI